MSASTKSPQPGPTVTTSKALTVGPEMVRPPRTSDIRAFARWSWSRGTSWGIRLAMAGNDIADTSPWTALSTTIIQISAVPVITSSAIAAWVTPEATLETWSTSARGSRSAMTPPQSRNSTIGMVWAASTQPRAVAESVISRTAKASATLGHHVAEGVDEAGREVPAEILLAKWGHRVLPRHGRHPTTAHERRQTS